MRSCLKLIDFFALNCSLKSPNTPKSGELALDFVTMRMTCNFSSPTIPVQLTLKFVRFSRFTFPSPNTIHWDRNLTMNAQRNQLSKQSSSHSEVMHEIDFLVNLFVYRIFFYPENVRESSSSSENSPSNVSRKHKASFSSRKTTKSSASGSGTSSGVMKRHVRSSSGYSSHNDETTFRSGGMKLTYF